MNVTLLSSSSFADESYRQKYGKVKNTDGRFPAQLHSSDLDKPL